MSSCELLKFDCVQADLMSNLIHVEQLLQQRLKEAKGVEQPLSVNLAFIPGTIVYVTFYPKKRKHLVSFLSTNAKDDETKSTLVTCLTGGPIHKLVDKFLELRETYNQAEFYDFDDHKWYSIKELKSHTL